MTDPFASLAHALATRAVRYVLIGVSGANFYASVLHAMFATQDYDLFLPSDADNLVEAWVACGDTGAELWLGNEPLDRPRDRWLAERMIRQLALTRITKGDDLQVDLSLVMKGYEFDQVWKERRIFLIEDVEIPTARLVHIIGSKQAAGRDKDRLFLATHKDALEQLLKPPRPE